MAARPEAITLLKKHSAYDLAAKLADFMDVFKLAAEHGGIRSYIVYLLYKNGEMGFWEIVRQTKFSQRWISQVLNDLKNELIVDVDKGTWFLSEQFLPK